MKKLLYKLQQWDVFWSAPLAFIGFVLFSFLGAQILGISFGAYDPAMYQAAIYAIAVSILFNGAIFFALWFNWRSVYYYYLKKSKQDFQQLTSWQRLLLLLATYWLYFFFLFILWAKLV